MLQILFYTFSIIMWVWAFVFIITGYSAWKDGYNPYKLTNPYGQFIANFSMIWVLVQFTYWISS